MGIRGLFTYVHNNNSFWINISQILEENKRSDEGPSKIIIDGPSLANQLHKLANLDSLCGGQYQEFYETVRGFLEAVKNTGFTPIVVLEEMMEERKRSLVLTRRVQKLEELNHCVHNGERIVKLPRMGYITFTQAVLDLEMEHVMCDSEADPVIAALASTLNAYVMSSDSDFFFTSIPGVFSIDFLSWKDGVLVGRFYRLEYFLEYHRLQLWNIPFVVMMLGNDFIPPVLFQVIASVREEASNHLSGNKISRVLQMVASFRTETVLMRFFESRLSPPHWRDFQHYYSTTVSSYLHPNSLMRIDPSLPHYGLEYKSIRERSDVSIESLLRVAWAWGAIFRRETLAQCNNEDFQRDPATDCSLNIRKYIYSFILRGGHIVEIGHTHSLSLKYNRIELLETLPDPNSSPIPNLDEIIKLPESVRLEIFLQIIQCSNPKLLQLKDPWRLLAFTLAYWYSHCKPRPLKSLIEIIIVSCVIAYKHHWKDYSNFSRNINKEISHHLLPYHQVSQWHATQHDLYRLAMVLCLPLLSPRIFYDGRLLFQIIINSEFREDQLHKFINERNQLWIHFFTDLIVQPSKE